MKKKLVWGNSSYTILFEDNIVLENTNTACFSEFMGRFNGKYDTIRIRDIDCEDTIEYKNWFLQYVIDMFKLEGTFNDEYFEFKTQGNKRKDAVVMSVVRLLWEKIGNMDGVDTPNELFKKLRDEPNPFRDKLKKFCHVYKGINTENKGYFSNGHSWKPSDTRIRSTKEYVEKQDFTSVNAFFSTTGY